MSERASTFLGVVLFGFVLLVYGLVAVMTVGAAKPVKLDSAKASFFKIPFSDQGQIDLPYGGISHECCDCGLTHHVAVVLVDDGVEMYWWVNQFATRKARARKGFHLPNPYSAESRGEPMRQDEFGER